MANDKQHIVPHPEGWAIKKENSERYTGIFPTKEDALERGREIARNQNTELVIHDRHGRIQDSDSYGHDPCPPKDKKP